jgi:thioredoxin reductase (NADPH)
MKRNMHVPLLIIGSGPAGYTAGIYAGRAGFSPLLLTGFHIGGQLMTTTEIENFPGFPEGISGSELMSRMKQQAERFGTTCLSEEVVSLDTEKRPFIITTEKGNEYTADAVILSTGATAKWLGIPSESAYRNRGVSGCATCDGFFFKGKPVAVLGGGDTALTEALFLSKFCESVTIIHRRNVFKASDLMIKRAKENPKILFEIPYEVDEFLGDGTKLTQVRLKNSETQEKKEIEVSACFIAIGHTPNSSLFSSLEKDDQGYLKTLPNSTKTNIPGIFACGDIKDPVFKQGVTAAGSGAMAAIEAERFLEGM